MLTLAEAQEQLQQVGRYLVANDLTWGSAGNLSARTGTNRCLITASGTFLGELTAASFVECAFDADAGAAQPKPSKELPMHRAIYEARPDINAVLHTSPFYSTLISCADVELPANWFVEGMYYLERVARVAYQHPGTAALGAAVRAQATSANILLLENHGVLVYDTSVREAAMGLHTLEIACRMYLAATSAQLPIAGLPGEVVSDFLQRSAYKPRRVWL